MPSIRNPNQKRKAFFKNGGANSRSGWRGLAPTHCHPVTAWDFSSVRSILQIVIIALVIALIGFYRMAAGTVLTVDSGTGRRRTRGPYYLGERVGADESAADLFCEAEALAREGNLRGAIRKGYIAVLCELAIGRSSASRVTRPIVITCATCARSKASFRT